MKSKNLPQFSHINPEKIVPQLQELLQNNRQAIQKLLTNGGPFTWENLFQPLEDLESHLHRFWSPISHLHAVADSPALREVYNQALPLLTEYYTELGHLQPLYQAIVQVAESKAHEHFNPAQKMVVKHFLRDFKLAGVSLPPAQKLEFAELSKALSQLGTQFEENVLDSTAGWIKHITDANELKGLPEIAIQAAQTAASERLLPGWSLPWKRLLIKPS